MGAVNAQPVKVLGASACWSNTQCSCSSGSASGADIGAGGAICGWLFVPGPVPGPLAGCCVRPREEDARTCLDTTRPGTLCRVSAAPRARRGRAAPRSPPRPPAPARERSGQAPDASCGAGLVSWGPGAAVQVLLWRPRADFHWAGAGRGAQPSCFPPPPLGASIQLFSILSTLRVCVAPRPVPNRGPHLRAEPGPSAGPRHGARLHCAGARLSSLLFRLSRQQAPHRLGEAARSSSILRAARAGPRQRSGAHWALQRPWTSRPFMWHAGQPDRARWRCQGQQSAVSGAPSAAAPGRPRRWAGARWCGRM